MVYILAFIGMVFWGISPLFAKFGLKNVDPLVGLCVRTLFTSVAILLWMFINGSIIQLKTVPVRSIFLLIIEAALATVIGDWAYFAALKRGSASIVMLIMACSPLVTILCSAVFLSERMTFLNCIGACLIVIGVVLVV